MEEKYPRRAGQGFFDPSICFLTIQVSTLQNAQGDNDDADDYDDDDDDHQNVNVHDFDIFGFMFVAKCSHVNLNFVIIIFCV